MPMKEGMDRRELLKSALAAALAGSVEGVHAQEAPKNQPPQAEKIYEMKLVLDELKEKTEELRQAFANKDKDPETYARVSKEVGELFEKAKPLIENLEK